MLNPQLEGLYEKNPKLKPSENECEDAIVAAAMSLGYRVHVQRKAWTASGVRTTIKGNVGWPDVVVAGWGHVWVVELKRKPNRPTDDQVAWVDTLAGGGVDARVLWVPEDLDEFIQELVSTRDEARRALRKEQQI